MEKEIRTSSQIKSAERETVLTEFETSRLEKYILDFSKDMILSILLAKGETARLTQKGKYFIDEMKKRRLEIIARKLAPAYLKRLIEMGFPENDIDFEIHKIEINKLLKERGE